MEYERFSYAVEEYYSAKGVDVITISLDREGLLDEIVDLIKDSTYSKVITAKSSEEGILIEVPNNETTDVETEERVSIKSLIRRYIRDNYGDEIDSFHVGSNDYESAAFHGFKDHIGIEERERTVYDLTDSD